MENGRVVKLELTEAGLTGAVPAEIGRLTSLVSLDLWYNQLESLPDVIGQLTALKELYLEGNKLTTLPTEIGQLTSLEWLHLDGNQLTSVPAEIGQLTSLRKLYLDGNQLTSLPARIRELRADWLPRTSLAPRLPGDPCEVIMDDGVTFDEFPVPKNRLTLK